MSGNTYPNHKVWQRKKIAIVVFSIVAFGLISISLGYILSTPPTVFAQQVDVCDDDPLPGGGAVMCPCNNCFSGCSGGGCIDQDADGVCDAYDNCVGNETIETTEGCESYCDGDENPITGECDGEINIDCGVTGIYIRCSR